MLLSRGRIRSIRSCRLTIGLALLTGGSSEALLEQILTPSQFERNVQTKSESLESVEYGIKLPGRVEDADSVVRLPVDSKYPIEDYQTLDGGSGAGGPRCTGRIHQSSMALVPALTLSVYALARTDRKG
jgi:hypothetical protein